MSKKDGRPAEGPGNNLNDEDLKKIISDIVFYCLVADQKKAVIKRADIFKNCDLGKKPKSVQDHVMSAAITQLADVFGIKMKEFSDKKGQYVLLNQLTEPHGEFLSWSEKDLGQMGITFTILAVIFMSSNGKITDEELFKFLKTLGLADDDKTKSNRAAQGDEYDVTEITEGDIRKFVNEVLVTRQQYLKREAVQHPEAEVTYEYAWGDRAEMEIKKSLVLRFVCDVYNCSPELFREQLSRVIQEEGEGAIDTDEN